MLLKELMTPNVEIIPEDATIREAAERMADLDVGFLPVGDSESGLSGVITDRDITIRAVARGLDPEVTRVLDVMTNDAEFCCEDDDAEDAARLMQEKKIRRVLVCDRKKRPVGVVSLGDLAVHTDEMELSAEALERISEPAMPER
jgi:CBS domain-containing protein